MLVNTYPCTLEEEKMVVKVIDKRGQISSYLRSTEVNLEWNNLLIQQFGEIYKVPPSIYNLINKEADFDITKINIDAEMTVPRVIEDLINPKTIIDFANNRITGCKINATNSIREENKRMKVVGYVQDEDDNLNLVTELFLEVEDNVDNAIEEKQILNRIKYLLYELHQESKRDGISYISIVIGIARSTRDHQGLKVTKTRLLEKGIYLMNEMGYITRSIDTKNTAFLTAWSRIFEGDLNVTVKTIMSLFNRLADVRLSDQDATQLQEDYFNTLDLSDIPTNVEYLKVKVVFDEKTAINNFFAENPDITNLRVIIPEDYFSDADVEKQTSDIIKMYEEGFRIKVVDKFCTFINGILCNRLKEPILFDMTLLTKEGQTIGSKSYAVLLSSGIFGKIGGSKIEILPRELFIEYFTAFFKDPNYLVKTYTKNNYQYGTWVAGE